MITRSKASPRVRQDHRARAARGPTARKKLTGPSTRSPFSSKRMSPRMPSSTMVRRSSAFTDARVPSERAIASSRISAACAPYVADVPGSRSSSVSGLELLEESLPRRAGARRRARRTARGTSPWRPAPRALTNPSAKHEAVVRDERHVRAEGGAEIAKQLAFVPLVDPEDRDCVRSRSCDPPGETGRSRELRSSSGRRRQRRARGFAPPCARRRGMPSVVAEEEHALRPQLPRELDLSHGE